MTKYKNTICANQLETKRQKFLPKNINAILLIVRVIMMMMMTMMMMMACRHIPTMTKSHHDGEMSVMIKVGMCQCQILTIHDKLQRLALVSCSSPQC